MKFRTLNTYKGKKVSKKAKKSAKKRAKRVKKGTKLALKNAPVVMSGARHLEALAKVAKRHPMAVYDILSAVRGPDFGVFTDSLKEKYTGVIRTWIFGHGNIGDLVQSREAPVTEKGWCELGNEAWKETDPHGGGKNHFIGHISTACGAIGRLYENGTFKEGT